MKTEKVGEGGNPNAVLGSRGGKREEQKPLERRTDEQMSDINNYEEL